MQVKVKKTSEKAVLPKYETSGAACFDLTAISKQIKLLNTGLVVEYDTGLAFEIPDGYVGLIFPRSSISSTTNVNLGNCVGVIDSDYRGSIKAQFRRANFESPLKDYNIGDRIMQMMIIPIQQVSLVESLELSTTDRGSRGFGSTGK